MLTVQLRDDGKMFSKMWFDSGYINPYPRKSCDMLEISTNAFVWVTSRQMSHTSQPTRPPPLMYDK